LGKPSSSLNNCGTGNLRLGRVTAKLSRITNCVIRAVKLRKW
jgi:hypothetical protein